MSDESGESLGDKLGDIGTGDGELPSIDLDTDFGEIEGLGETTATGTAGPEGGGPGRRIGGLLALVLGIVGSVVMVVLAAASIRAGFGASDTVDRAMEPVELSFDRMEARIDEGDDLVDSDGIAPERVAELRARVDGLVDVSTGANQLFEAVDDHPIYRFLPAELSTLGDALAGFEESSMRIDGALGATSGSQVSDRVANEVAAELDDMQARVSDVREMISDASSSLRRWIRLGSFLGFLGSLWGLWGQISLAKRGWRGFRGRPPA